MNKSANQKKYAKAKGISYVTIVPQLVISAIIAGLILIFIDFLTNDFFKNTQAKGIIIFLVIIFLLENLKGNLISTFGAFNLYLPYSLYSPFNSVLVLSTLLILSRFSNSINIIPLAYLIVQIALIVIGYIIYKVKIKELNVAPKFDKKTNKAVFKYAFATIFATFGGMILAQTDVFVLTLMKGTASVGYYNIIIPSLNIILLLISPAFALINPILVNYYHQNKKKLISEILSKIFNNLLIVLLPLSLIFVIYAKEVIGILFTEKYIAATFGLQIYAVFFVFLFLKNINIGILGCIGEPGKSSKIVMIGAIFNIIADVLLIYFFDFVGAIIATGIALTIMTILSMKAISKKISIEWDILKQIKIILASSIFIIACNFLKNAIFLGTSKFLIVLNGFVVFSIGIILYITLLFTFRVITKESIRSAIRLIRKN